MGEDGWVKHLPSAQGHGPRSWHGVPHWAPWSEGNLLLPVPATPTPCALSIK